jgi:hypothetical protein
MQQLALLLALIISTFFAATTTASAQSHPPTIYIMMKDGKLTEVINGKKDPVNQDITLANGTTIHPNGNIDDKDGNKKQLNEGEYMTMDGRIRLLKNMAGGGVSTPAKAPAKTTKH